MGPRRYVEPVWQRGVLWGEGELQDSAIVPGGVVLLATPQSVLYSQGGERLVEVPWPPETPTTGDWFAYGSLALASGGFVARTIKVDGQIFLRWYRGDTLQEQVVLPFDAGADALSLVEYDGALYALARRFDDTYILHTIVDGSIVESRPIALQQPYLVSRRGYPTSDGKLLFCAAHPTGTVALRIDPTTATAATVDLGIRNNISGCHMARGDNGLIMLWNRYSHIEWVLMDRDGTELRAGPFTPEDFGQLHRVNPQYLLYAGGQFVFMTQTTDRLMLHAIDETTGEIFRPWDVRLEPGDEFYGIDRVTLVTDGDYLYVGIGTSVPPPFRIKLQKLPLLSSLQ